MLTSRFLHIGRLSGSVHPNEVVKSPWGSASTRSTFFPTLANPTPKFTVVVVFSVLCEASHKTGYEK